MTESLTLLPASNCARFRCSYQRVLVNLRVHSCPLFRFPKRLSFHEHYRSGDQKYEPQDKKTPLLSQIKSGLQIMKEEISLWKDEVKEHVRMDPKIYTPGDTVILWRFNSKEEIDKWTVTSDKMNDDGFSECELIQTKYNHGLFNGFLDKRLPKDGRVVRTGYCNITAYPPKKSFGRESYFDWECFTHLALRIRGDGRTYSVILNTSGYYDVNWFSTYNFVLYTRGGPYWQFAKLPFSKFMLVSKSRIQDKQGPVPLNRVKAIGITCADRSQGPFHLEIDYIGVHWDPNHTEEFAYEMYYAPHLYIY